MAHISRDSMEKWMNRAEADGMGARTRNTYRSAVVAFCNWCVETDRLVADLSLDNQILKEAAEGNF